MSDHSGDSYKVELALGVSLKNPRARQVLNALGVENYRPPTPPTGEETVM